MATTNGRSHARYRCLHTPDDLQRDKAELLEALRDVRDSLANWMEIQDEEDARDYDEEALAKADALLAKHKSAQS